MIPDVDAAMLDKFDGFILVGEVDEVQVFLEHPSPERFPERVFPSISIRLIGAYPDLEREESDVVDAEEYLVSAVPDIPNAETRVYKQPFEPMNLRYRVDTWILNDSMKERELLQFIHKVAPARGYLTVGGQDIWLIRDAAGMTTADEVEGDRVVYHKSFSYIVKAPIDHEILNDPVNVVRNDPEITQGITNPQNPLVGYRTGGTC